MENRQEAAITGGQLQAMLMGAYQSFEKNYEMINSLNVFPVPDGGKSYFGNGDGRFGVY